MESQNEITLLLRQLTDGKNNAVNALMPLVYDQLHKMAQQRLRNEARGQTLNATSLVHEAYLKLVDQNRVTWQNRSHFFAIASQAMRRIIISHARNRIAQKRGGGQERITLNEDSIQREVRPEELVTVDEALQRLEKINTRQSKIIEYWFFIGLSHEEIASLLDVSLPTIRRDWRLARAWLSRECKSEV